MESSSKKLKTDPGTSDRKTRSKSKETKTLAPSASVVLKYDELRIIFKYLSAQELWVAAQVCKSWKDAASNEINTRLYPQYIFKDFTATPSKCEDQSDTPDTEHLYNALYIKPRVGIAFVKLNDDSDAQNEAISYCYCVPSSCDTLPILSSYDIVADDKNTTGNELAVVSFLPKIPNLEVQSHTISLLKNRFICSYDSSQLFEKAKQFFESHVFESDKTSKCVILLTTINEDMGVIAKIIEYFQKRYKPGKLALWGGECKELQTHDLSSVHSSEMSNIIFTAVTLSSPSLQSWSVVLPKACRSKNDMEKRLQQFREKIQLKKHSSALMCACVAREKNKKKEIDAFKKVFPKTPLVGFLGDGEFGLNSLSTEREKYIKLSYSTVFLILTY